jgi:hypothetical protein
MSNRPLPFNPTVRKNAAKAKKRPRMGSSGIVVD